MKVGDEPTIQCGQKNVTVRVELLSESTRKEDAAKMYTLLKEEMHKKDYWSL
ncbi:hypothetical protein D3C73_1465240 [compost metagenome]